MKALIVVGHPAAGSFNHAIALTIRDAWETAGCEIAFHDLMAERFDPLLTAAEARRGWLAEADRLARKALSTAAKKER